MGAYNSKSSISGSKEDVSTQCNVSRKTRTLMTSSPSHIASNQTPQSLSSIEPVDNNTTITEAIVYAAIQKCLRDRELVKHLSDAVSKATTTTKEHNRKKRQNFDGQSLDHFADHDGHAIDESSEALDLIGLSSDGSDTTIKVDVVASCEVNKPTLTKSQSESDIADVNTPEKSVPIPSKQEISATSGPAFRRDGQRKNNDRSFVVGSDGHHRSTGGEDSIERRMLMIRSKTRQKYEQLPELISQRQQQLENEIGRLRKQCLSQELLLSIRRSSTRNGGSLLKQMGKNVATPTSTNAAIRHNSFTGDQQTADELILSAFQQQDPTAMTARIMLRKVASCLGDIKEAISLISDGLESVDCLLSECCDDEIEGGEHHQQTTPNNTTKLDQQKQVTPIGKSTSVNSAAICKSVPIAKTYIKRNNNGKENKLSSVTQRNKPCRKTSSSFSVSQDDKVLTPKESDENNSSSI